MTLAYATFDELKDALGDALGSSTTTYDVPMRVLAERASRSIDRLTGRQFWPETLTRYPDGSGTAELWIPECLGLTTVSMSSDDGANYTDLLATDYVVYGGPLLEYNRTPYLRLDMYTNGTYSYWYTGQRAIKIVGLWGWHDDYGNAWEDSQDTTEDTTLSATATTITVNDADGADLTGLTPRFQIGQMLRIESEYVFVTAVTAGTTNTLTVVRVYNGSTEATHAQNTIIYIYRPPMLIKQATTIQSLRWFKRGQQSFADVSAMGELGQLTYAQKIDPDIVAMLFDAGLRRATV